MQTVNLSIIDDTPRISPNEVKKHFHITINLPESTEERDVDIVLKVSELQQLAASEMVTAIKQ